MTSSLEPAQPDLVTQFARGLLLSADALGVVPTPIDALLAASELTPAEQLIDLGANPTERFGRMKRVLDKVLGALAIREQIVFIHPDQAVPRRRFVQGHELGHNVMPWHRDAYGYYEDDASTVLAKSSVDLLESEADRFSADILFQIDKFNDAADSYGPSLDVPLALAEDWMTSRHATIRRYVEGSHRPMALLLLGRLLVHKTDGEYVRVLNTFESPIFRSRFGPAADLLPRTLSTTNSAIGQDARMALLGLTGNRPATGSATLATTGKFGYEVYFNQYVVFVLLYPASRLQLGRRLSVVAVLTSDPSSPDSD